MLADDATIILTTLNDNVMLVDREGQILQSFPMGDFQLGYSGIKLVPGKPQLVSLHGGTGSSTDHRDGLWAVDLDNQSLYPLADLFNEGEPFVRLIEDNLGLDMNSVFISPDFAWSADGRALVFEVTQDLPIERQWHRTFVRVDLDTHSVAVLGAIEAATTTPISYSPAADGVAVSVYPDNATCLLTFIGVRDTPIQINDSGLAFAAAWSPDGKWVAYAYAENESAPARIWLVSATGEEPILIMDLQAERIGDLVWSPDGGTLLVSARVGEEVGIWAVPVSESNP